MRANHPGKMLSNLADAKMTKVALCTVAFLLLTGAEGDGCLPGETDPPSEPPQPPTEMCPPGSHLETICEGGEPGYGAHDPGTDPDCANPDGPPMPMGHTGSLCGGGDAPNHEPGCDCGCGGGGCYDVCVPDEVCPPGSYEEWICEGEGELPPEFCDDPDGCLPEPGQCYPICVPIEPCGPDMHEEWICTGGPDPLPEPPPEPCLDPNGCEPPPPPEEYCELVCLPNDGCGPDMHEEWVCEEPPPPEPCLDPDGCLPPEPQPDPCYLTCVPDGPCPPGSEPIVNCDEQINECWAECVPVDPQCPPETYPELVCDEQDCWMQCFPIDPVDPACPPETMPEPVCNEQDCWLECVPM